VYDSPEVNEIDNWKRNSNGAGKNAKTRHEIDCSLLSQGFNTVLRSRIDLLVFALTIGHSMLL
jgi:hypothetical protein